MRITITGTAASSAAVEIVEMGDEAATACDSRGFERDSPPRAARRSTPAADAESAAVRRARGSASLSPLGHAAQLVELGDWLDNRRGWSHQIILGAVIFSASGRAERNYIRAAFSLDSSPWQTLSVWIDFSAGELRALLPPSSSAANNAALDAQLDALRGAVESLGLSRAHHKII